MTGALAGSGPAPAPAASNAAAAAPPPAPAETTAAGSIRNPPPLLSPPAVAPTAASALTVTPPPPSLSTGSPAAGVQLWQQFQLSGSSFNFLTCLSRPGSDRLGLQEALWRNLPRYARLHPSGSGHGRFDVHGAVAVLMLPCAYAQARRQPPVRRRQAPRRRLPLRHPPVHITAHAYLCSAAGDCGAIPYVAQHPCNLYDRTERNCLWQEP